MIKGHPAVGWDTWMFLGNCPGGGGGGTPIHYLYGYVPPNGVMILKLLI